MEQRFEFVIPGIASKVRLEDYLLDEFATVSKMYLRELVKTERCEVNGRNENIGYRLKGNDLVEIWVDQTRGTAMRPEEIDLNVLHDDNDIIVVNKPAGMLAHPSHRENSGTLLNALVYHLNRSGGRLVRPGLIHRLDKDTSGLMVVAKTARAHRTLSRHFLKKRVEKRYSGLVEGTIDVDDGVIEAPIGRFAELKQWNVKTDGKRAETRFWVRKRFANATLLELEPVTGRTNQLRIHCQHLGHPIVGDPQRGGRKAERLYLHASKLAFPHPASNEMISFSSAAEFPPLI